MSGFSYIYGWYSKTNFIQKACENVKA